MTNLLKEKYLNQILKVFFYNLIINSIEAFEKSRCKERTINIYLKNDSESIMFVYKDNGPGLADIFENPYEILTMEQQVRWIKREIQLELEWECIL